MAKCLTFAESRNLWMVRTFNENMESSDESYSWHYDDEAFTVYGSQSPFRSSQNRFYRIVGSCKGVLCLADDRPSYLNDLILWNPTIGKWFRLPPAGVSKFEVEHIVSFGYDGPSYEYKVIRIVYLGEALPKVVLYTLNSGTWKDISHLADELKILIIRGESQVFLKGAAHWIARDKETDSYIILCFHMGKEVFLRIEAPTVLAFASPSVIEGLLSVVATDCFMEKCCIWKMKEYGVASSWAKHLVIDRAFDSIFGFRINGELLVECSGCLMSYHPQTKELKSLGVKSSGGYLGKSLHAERFCETSVLSEIGIDVERERERERESFLKQQMEENVKTKKEKRQERKEEKKLKKKMYRELAKQKNQFPELSIAGQDLDGKKGMSQ